jgi:hypothetical protein
LHVMCHTNLYGAPLSATPENFRASNCLWCTPLYVSVNYAMRFSGPVTALTARRVRYGVGADLICQLGPSPGIKTHSSPAAFPTTLSLSFVPFPSPTLLHRPLVPQAAPSSTYSPARPPSPHRTDTTRPVGKMSQLTLIRSTPRQRCLVDRLTRRPLTVTPMKRPAFQQVAGDLVTRRP